MADDARCADYASAGDGVAVEPLDKPMEVYCMSSDRFEFTKLGRFKSDPALSAKSNSRRKKQFESRLAEAIARDEKNLKVKIRHGAFKVMSQSDDGEDETSDDGGMDAEEQVATDSGPAVEHTNAPATADGSGTTSDDSGRTVSDDDFEFGGATHGAASASTSKAKTVKKANKVTKAVKWQRPQIPRIPTVAGDAVAAKTPRQTARKGKAVAAAASPATSTPRKRRSDPPASPRKRLDSQRSCQVDDCYIVAEGSGKSIYCKAHTNMIDRIKHKKSPIWLESTPSKPWTPALRRQIFEEWLQDEEQGIDLPVEGEHKEWGEKHKDKFTEWIDEHADEFLDKYLER